MKLPRHQQPRRRIVAAAACVFGLVLGPGSVAFAADDFSAAERVLFMTNQLASIKPPTTLRYGYTKTGSLEEGFTDKVSVDLVARTDGGCCAATSQFLSGARALTMPEVEAAEGNPAVLYFLERDIREMNRLTKGQANYFRKRIRMAVYQGATMRDITVPYRGKSVAAQQIIVKPYADDPLRERFEKLSNKTYTFTLSDAVPGGVLALRSQIDAPTGSAAPLLVEEMLLDGAGPVPRNL